MLQIKKKVFLGYILIVIALLFLVITQHKKATRQDIHFKASDSTVLAIDDIRVNKEEYLLHLKREIAMTYNYFYQNYGIENSPTFWVTPINNIKPIDFIKKQTNKKVIESKTIHALAKKYNVIEEFDFNEFKLQWKEYNRSRKETHDKGGVVYGSIYTNMSGYYNYLLSNLEIRVKEKLKKNKFTANEETLSEFYESIKKDKFSYSEKIDIESFGFEYSVLPYKQALQKIREIKDELDKGLVLEKSLEKTFVTGVYHQKVFYDSVPIYGEDNPDEIIKQNAQKLKLNEHKIVRAQEGIYIIKLNKSLEKKYHPFQKVKEQVLQYYQEEKYHNFIEKQKKNMVITINNSIYNTISDKTFK